MKPVSCAVIDDEPIAREILQEFIAADERLVLNGMYKNAREALVGLSQQPAELLLLDINMPGLSGFQLLKSMQQPPAVIFTTAYREYALEGFEANAIDYLLKPIAVERFLLAINKALKFLRPTIETFIDKENAPSKQEEKNFFFVKANGALVKIFFDEILFIEALKEYVKIVTIYKPVVTYHTISGLVEKLPAKNFYRIHRSFIVNIQAITGIEGNFVKIKEHELPLSRNEREAFIAFIASGKIISK